MVDPHVHPEDTVALSKFTPHVRIWGYAFPDVFQICIKMDDILLIRLMKTDWLAFKLYGWETRKWASDHHQFKLV